MGPWRRTRAAKAASSFLLTTASSSWASVNPAPSRSSTALRRWSRTGFKVLVAMSITPSPASLGLYLYLPHRGRFLPLFLVQNRRLKERRPGLGTNGHKSSVHVAGVFVRR